jgi:hypothetical protein
LFFSPTLHKYYNRRPSQKLQKLLDEHILPVGREITQGWESTLNDVESNEVQDALERDLEGLKFAFVYYAHLKPKETKSRATAGTPATYLTMAEFLYAMLQTGLLINSETQVDLRGSHLTMQRAQECFVAANSHSSRLQRKNTAAAEERSFRQMEFVSFWCQRFILLLFLVILIVSAASSFPRYYFSHLTSHICCLFFFLF